MAYYTNIRYGKMLLVSRFKTDRDDLRERDRCVVKTDRGKEMGVILSKLEPLQEDQTKSAIHSILRKATEDDLATADRIDTENRIKSMTYCKEQVKKLNLKMKMVEVDHLFGGERVIFYFTAESRVDFRELVRALAREFRTRVELRQIGQRDEARLVGDGGHCGLKLCCQGFIKELGGITMEMAKIQKHTSDPSKITGRCGKLLCCLRYEYSSYKEAKKALPRRGKTIQTRAGAGTVVDQNLLLREVTIESEGGQRRVVTLDEIQEVKETLVSGCSGCGEPKGGPQEKKDPGKAVAESKPDTVKLDTQVRRKIEQETQVMPPKVSDDPQPPGEGEPPRKKRRRRRRRRKGKGGPPPAGGGPTSS